MKTLNPHNAGKMRFRNNPYLNSPCKLCKQYSTLGIKVNTSEEIMLEKDYYIGLDMGTSSVGWAVTDEEYSLVRAKGKDLWGVRLFPEASIAEGRRSMRTSRRRRQREKARIGYLRELFAEEINKIDPGFYQRLDDSKFFEEDKIEKQPFALFADTGYTDVDYYKEYPTVFHLRKALANAQPEDVFDIRLIFLAVLHIFKHRGHFLNVNLKAGKIEDIAPVVEELIEFVNEYDSTAIPEELKDAVETVLPSKNLSNSKKHEELLRITGIDKRKDKQENEILKMLCGLTGKLVTAFPEEELEEDDAKFALSFRDASFDEKIIKAEEILSEEAFEILLIMKRIYDWGILSNLMKSDAGTYAFISEARVASYEKHKKDLSILKKLIKENAPKEYSAMFRRMEVGNYSAYVGSVNSGVEKARRTASASREDLYKRIKSVVEKMPESEEKAYILDEIDKENFLPKQMTADNGVIPYQVHMTELIAILENAESYLPWLKDVDESGLSVSKRIVEVFKFQIPYYVGPLVNDGSGNAWVKRKEGGRVFPWNFSQKIDEKESAERFIERMVKHCTYIDSETVLPKNSLLYEKFSVLNELNNLKINGNDISVSIKQEIYNELFTSGNKVKLSDVEKILKMNGHVDKNETVEFTGVDGGFTNNLATQKRFAIILNVDALNYEQEKMAEKIIFWSTVYGDSKKFLKEKIVNEYGEVLTAAQIKKIMSLKFKEWGRLSKEVLTLQGEDNSTGEVRSLLTCMWETNNNLMQLLSSDFTYAEKIRKKASKIEKCLSDFEYEDLDGMYMSAPVKRMTWQTILILKEIATVLGKEPKRIFVEMARGADGSDRKQSRKKKFEELYKGCKVDGRNWSKEIKETDESRFKSKKLFLYYTQQGKCMYSGEAIDLDDLFNDNLYDIDHIYPRHFTKDDSLENNLVLVKKQYNAHKSDVYPLEASIHASRKKLWKHLRDGNFITEEKYSRLIRTREFDDAEKAAFISRQIVETRQGTKLITALLENASKNTEIVYVKAGNVSQFRQKYDLIKNRLINDFHHANDAYLNIVVGNTYYVKFTKNPINFVREYDRDPLKHKYHMYKMFDYNVARGSEIAWIADNDKSMSIVKRVMRRNTPLVTRMSYEAHGGLADQQIRKASEAATGSGYIPIKESDDRLHDVAKYGGFRKYLGTYFFLVEHTAKGKRVRTIEAMPLYLKDKLNTSEKMVEYCRNELGYVDPVICVEKIKMYSKIKVNGYPLYITGRTGNQLLVSSAAQMILDYEHSRYIKLFDSGFDSSKAERDINISIYDTLADKYKNGIFKLRPNPIGDKLDNARDKFIALSLEEQIDVIKNILQLTVHNQGVDLRKIGESSKSGKMLISKNLSAMREAKLINESVTGIFVVEKDLLK